MTDEEKAKWFDLIVEQDLQVSKGPLGWGVNQGHSGYRGSGDYVDDSVGDSLNEAYKAFLATEEAETKRREEDLARYHARKQEQLNDSSRARFTSSNGPNPNTWGGGMA